MNRILLFLCGILIYYISRYNCIHGNGFSVGYSSENDSNLLPNFSNCDMTSTFPKMFTCTDLQPRQLTIDALCSNLKGVCERLDDKTLCQESWYAGCHKIIPW